MFVYKHFLVILRNFEKMGRKMKSKEADEASAYFSSPVKTRKRSASDNNTLTAKIEPKAEPKRKVPAAKKVPKSAASDKAVKKASQQNVTDIEDLATWQPSNWKEILEHIRTMRSGKDAPVDSMGCDQCAEPTASPQVQRLHHLLSLMLSSQTKDEVTFAAMARLRGIPGGLTIDTILAMPENELGQLIIPVGFWKSKARYIKSTCAILKEKFDGDIPNTIEGLCSLPGVGPKMGHLCMQSAWGVVSGIGVDTHVHRISNRLGWVRNTSTPEKTRTELESWLPKSLWREVNHLLVGFGQTICKPMKPNCSECLANQLCPSAGKKPVTRGKTKK